MTGAGIKGWAIRAANVGTMGATGLEGRAVGNAQRRTFGGAGVLIGAVGNAQGVATAARGRAVAGADLNPAIQRHFHLQSGFKFLDRQAHERIVVQRDDLWAFFFVFHENTSVDTAQGCLVRDSKGFFRSSVLMIL